MKMIFGALAVLSAAAITTAAHAVGPREACRGDVKSFCSDVQPGGRRIIGCLQDHYKELSDDCYEVLQKLPEPGQGRGGRGAPPAPGGDNGDGPQPRGAGGDGPPPDSGQQN